MKSNINILSHDHFSFDLWLTLIKSHPEFKAKRVALFSSYFDVNKPLHEVSQTVKYYDDLCNSINEVLGGNVDTYEIYLLILNALDVDIKKINTFLLEDFYQKSEALFLEYQPQIIFEGLHDFFTEIKTQGKTINILSNTGFIKGKTMRKFLHSQELSQFIDFDIYSDEVNCSKPNPLIFQEVKNRLTNKNITSEKILHVGDNPIADYKGAKDFGFSAHLLTYY